MARGTRDGLIFATELETDLETEDADFDTDLETEDADLETEEADFFAKSDALKLLQEAKQMQIVRVRLVRMILLGVETISLF